jgi:hypothetical protein
MRAAVETFVGVVLLFGATFAFDCLPKTVRHASTAPSTAQATEPPPACPVTLKKAPFLCDRVLRDGSAECAVCSNDARGCKSSTGVYCVATGCDDAACMKRP